MECSSKFSSIGCKVAADGSGETTSDDGLIDSTPIEWRLDMISPNSFYERENNELLLLLLNN